MKSFSSVSVDRIQWGRIMVTVGIGQGFCTSCVSETTLFQPGLLDREHVRGKMSQNQLSAKADQSRLRTTRLQGLLATIINSPITLVSPYAFNWLNQEKSRLSVI